MQLLILKYILHCRRECDAAENSIVNYLDTTHYEVAPYFVKDNHTMSADILVMSTKTREKISEEDSESH